MNEEISQSKDQLGLLDLSVDLSVPEVYSGTEFTLYLHVKNPFSRPVWISSVELSLPVQLSVKNQRDSREEKAAESDSIEEYTWNVIRGREEEIKKLRKTLLDGNMADTDEAERIREKIRGLEMRNSADIAGVSGDMVVESSGDSSVYLNRPRNVSIVLKTSDKSDIYVNDYRREGEDGRVSLLGTLPAGVALQPGSTDVWTIRLGSRRTPFFTPARYKLQLTVVYGVESPESDGRSGSDRDLYSNTIAFSTQVRAALWSVIIGGVVGGVIGSVARSLQGAGGAVAFSGPRANSTAGALVLTAILSGAAIVFSARKSETQSFVTVEDFWGGLLVGFLIGYSGTAAFAKVTGNQP